MASGEGQSNPSTSGDAGRDHHEDFGNEYGPPLPTQEELREMEHRRLVGEATNLMLNFAEDPKLAKYMSETAFQDVQAQLKATTTSPPKPESKKQYSEKELEEEIDARLARILGAQKQGDVPDDGEPDEQPEVEENEEILVLEQILAHKDTKTKGKVRRRFLVKFKNYPALDAKWMEEEDLADTPQIVKLYLEAFGLA
ncbi:hypothetical protein L7F22_034587 [Adiantum nelumboides]|nr:hypothetical protein [Adiantum nelumboides]